jgi:hypothetical protein
MAIQYQTAADMAIILKYGTADEAVVAGLNTLHIPGLERGIVQVQEFRNDFDRKFAGGASTTAITYGGNLVTGDTKGQEQLKEYCKNNTKFTDCRIYLNYETSNLDSDFVTVDLANDESTAFQVTKHMPGEADVNGVIPFSGEMVLNGQYAGFIVHKTAAFALVAGNGTDIASTITDSGNGFVSAGFAAGQTLIIEGSTANDGQYIITQVAVGTITLGIGDLTAQSSGTAFTLHGGK